jgi:hypothetical protein
MRLSLGVVVGVRADWASGRGTGRDAGRGAQVAGRRALVAGHWSCVYLC